VMKVWKKLILYMVKFKKAVVVKEQLVVQMMVNRLVVQMLERVPQMGMKLL
ncbi:hypothetical protein COLO4_21237, partial [Corchorus olitorius]